ncbi:3-dehydroquinate synthase [Thermoleptolyngbya sichuanensis A183]|uniref:3-dehydroquinate synthase n=1 Tax=Thermoleptolyngbya sichuanensis A183 TaxID=2737172 RepID=A0A6M8BJC3_9CYAN|nr:MULTISPECIES: 3-dehydroquinate synthase [Thermoleptolyngbya]MDG2616367.1 3-dehydroquinate synthase [Thermoleptolyngbya sichuanensis XZ-Cy5]QKD83183.1 3-dehydroquinate synthase [Thermoleptolyngbya sichuanensis A183]
MNAVISVDLPQNSYEVAIAPGSLSQLGAWLQPLGLGRKLMLVSNPMIFRRYGEGAIASLEAAGFDVCHALIPAGERYKTLGSIQKLYDVALAHRLERSSAVVALGGGVVGDMAGFAAATWLRGIRFVQVPTSLLAMVDASIGGKTGVNHPHGKNLIGAFHQPRLVLIDPEVLATLPPREFRAGMAEVIKYGVIWDADLFQQLEQAKRLDQQRYVSPELMQTILTRSCQAKAHVVSKDEKEAGLRAILNYGHTIGHAVESLTGYKLVNHGEAVGIGMVAAGAIALQLNLWDADSNRRQTALIQKAGLPTRLPAGLDLEDIIATLQTDKKVKAGQVRFILPTQIGTVIETDQATPAVIRKVLLAMAEAA